MFKAASQYHLFMRLTFGFHLPNVKLVTCMSGVSSLEEIANLTISHFLLLLVCASDLMLLMQFYLIMASQSFLEIFNVSHNMLLLVL